LWFELSCVLLLCCSCAESNKVLQPLVDDLMPKGVAISDFQSDEITFKVWLAASHNHFTLFHSSCYGGMSYFTILSLLFKMCPTLNMLQD